MKSFRYMVLYFGKLVRSFATDQEASNWVAKAPWTYSTFGLRVERIEVGS